MWKKWLTILGFSVVLRKVVIWTVGKEKLIELFGGEPAAIVVVNLVAIYLVWRVYTLWVPYAKDE